MFQTLLQNKRNSNLAPELLEKLDTRILRQTLSAFPSEPPMSNGALFHNIRSASDIPEPLPHTPYHSEQYNSSNTPPIAPVSPIESTMICPDAEAAYLYNNQVRIKVDLEKGLSKLGYSGEYGLMAGFDEDFLEGGTLYSLIYLLLKGELKGSNKTVSKVLSPIFAPHSVRLHMRSRTLNLRPHATALGNDGGVRSPPPPPVSPHLLSGQPPSQINREMGQESAGESARDGNTSQGPSFMHQGVKAQMREADLYKRRRLELALSPTLQVRDRYNNIVHSFTTHAKIRIELRENRDGSDGPEGISDVDAAWSSIHFDSIQATSVDERNTEPGYSLSEFRVYIEARPKFTEFFNLLPLPVQPVANVEVYKERRKKGVFNFLCGLRKAEAKSESSAEHVSGEKSCIPHFSINPRDTKRYTDLGARIVLVDYTKQGSAPTSTVHFTPGPSVTLAYHPSQAGQTRTLRVYVRTFWTLKDKDLITTFFESGSKPLIHANFYHKTSFEVGLERLIPIGGDDDVLRGSTVICSEDTLQDDKNVGKDDTSAFAARPIQIQLNGGNCPIDIPLQRSVIGAVRGIVPRRDEGKKQVPSRDFKLPHYVLRRNN